MMIVIASRTGTVGVGARAAGFAGRNVVHEVTDSSCRPGLGVGASSSQALRSSVWAHGRDHRHPGGRRQPAGPGSGGKRRYCRVPQPEEAALQADSRTWH